MTTLTIIGIVVSAVLGSSLLSSIVTARSTSDNRAADVESIEVETAGRVVKIVSEQMLTMSDKIDELERKVTDLEHRLDESDTDRRLLRVQVERLHAHIDSLEALMRAEGIDPPPRPRPMGDTP